MKKMKTADKFGQVKALHKTRGIELIEREYAIEIREGSSSIIISSIEEIDLIIDALKYAKLAHHKKKFFTLSE
jgi:hypothetical protein